MAHISSTHPVCPALDTTRAGLARVRDAALGGKDNYSIDRDLVAALEHAAPGFSDLVRAERAWHIRAVRYLASIGVDQFLDCGLGLPTPFDNTHEIAQRHNDEARIVYADADCIVVAHGRALLEENERSLVIQADYTYPEELVPAADAFLDFTRPIGLLLTDTLHHVDDDAHPDKLMDTYRDALAPGSAIAVSHWWDPGAGPEHDAARALEATWQARCPQPGRYRTRTEIEALLDGLELVPPGLVTFDDWWPDGPTMTTPTPTRRLGLAAVGIKP
ncbi:SAM-dependent methyltransferase [Amycolatopsis sp. CA-230715]|uniref:SAM-dependent methyltransferase n=1 Tax=Amycolatopsis sp. CA-230715 TaxID=2745196 RepID=UPI001C00EBFB|nr:SAM-dependent methyltransferase [Amycolatopsis sp. CA-230715]QWF81078.1 hypothetical protein HUW46_04504 [Amycolatopsis sp. CA-230715]